MKHNVKITIIILAMFLVTQFIGLYVINYYSIEKVVDGNVVNVTNPNPLPYGMETPEVQEKDYAPNFISIIIAFVIAISLLFLLTRIRAKFFLRIWFLFVVLVALGISFIAIFEPILPPFQGISIMALIAVLPLALSKIYSRNILTHNFTELFIYPGIAAIFVPLLNWIYLIVLLVLISLYDMWAVWKSGLMQKMAKYQMDTLKVFGGFFVPYLSKSQKTKLKKMRKTNSNSKGIKVNVAILGGGDIVFSMIAAGVMLKTLGIGAAIITLFGALLGLGTLLLFSEKKKFYPAMPFISAGIFLAIGISFLIW
ncbi:MAG: hypothetical protein KC516_01090 [Nanoarchaeota archaeon]|nr:hypothetical protein [Nanoarchaeota archaeon]